MNRDDIIRIARECGLTINDAPMLGVEHFAALVAAAEREACARVCEQGLPFGLEQTIGPAMCAASIRARGDE